ncbi:MAG: helix-turn-helix domain-containing protein [Silvanigrellaceae bacterium]
MLEQTKNKGRWCKLAEASQLLGVSEITVRRKARSGQLKAILRNGRYMVFLEEDAELGMFTAGIDSTVAPLNVAQPTPTLGSGSRRTSRTEQNSGQDEVIQSLKRTIEDQQTLISSLEASISRLSQKLAAERNSNR